MAAEIWTALLAGVAAVVAIIGAVVAGRQARIAAAQREAVDGQVTSATRAGDEAREQLTLARQQVAAAETQAALAREQAEAAEAQSADARRAADAAQEQLALLRKELDTERAAREEREGPALRVEAYRRTGQRTRRTVRITMDGGPPEIDVRASIVAVDAATGHAGQLLLAPTTQRMARGQQVTFDVEIGALIEDVTAEVLLRCTEVGGERTWTRRQSITFARPSRSYF